MIADDDLIIIAVNGGAFKIMIDIVYISIPLHHWWCYYDEDWF